MSAAAARLGRALGLVRPCFTIKNCSLAAAREGAGAGAGEGVEAEADERCQCQSSLSCLFAQWHKADAQHILAVCVDKQHLQQTHKYTHTNAHAHTLADSQSGQHSSPHP